MSTEDLIISRTTRIGLGRPMWLRTLHYIRALPTP